MSEKGAALTAATHITIRNLSMSDVNRDCDAASIPRNCESHAGGSSTLGFGAGLQTVPPPILRHNASSAVETRMVREPLLHQQLPGIQEILCDVPAQQPSKKSLLCARQPESKFSATDQVQKVLRLNPYACQADKIGPRHRIPGLGFIGDLLTPPGWKLGDAAINEDQAYQAYQHSRERAKRTLEDSVAELEHLSGEDHRKRCAERDSAWDCQLELDNLLLKERINVFKAYEQKKQGNKLQLLRSIPT